MRAHALSNCQFHFRLKKQKKKDLIKHSTWLIMQIVSDYTLLQGWLLFQPKYGDMPQTFSSCRISFQGEISQLTAATKYLDIAWNIQTPQLMISMSVTTGLYREGKPRNRSLNGSVWITETSQLRFGGGQLIFYTNCTRDTYKEQKCQSGCYFDTNLKYLSYWSQKAMQRRITSAKGY